MEIEIDNLEDTDIAALLEEHLTDMYAISPPESVHTLNLESLKSPDITLWCARDNGRPLGCIALKQLNTTEAEIKSMRTTKLSRGKGVASALLRNVLIESSKRGYEKLNLETGSQAFFKPACKLYEKFGFQYRGPFGNYKPDPNSLFMELKLPTTTI